MSGSKTHLSAFDKGRKAATMGPDAANPFADGSVDYDNFERGRRFGIDQAAQDAAFWRGRPETIRPDIDEGDA